VTIGIVGTDKVSAAFTAWRAAEKAWAEGERRLAELTHIRWGVPPVQLVEEVAALKVEADRLLATSMEELARDDSSFVGTSFDQHQD